MGASKVIVKRLCFNDSFRKHHIVHSLDLKVCLHIPSSYPSPCPSSSKFNIVLMVTDTLMDILGVQPIQPITHRHNVKL